MPNLSLMPAKELVLYARETARLVSAGHNLDHICHQLNWPLGDVQELCKREEFLNALDAIHPDLRNSFNALHRDSKLTETQDFVRDRLTNYISALDKMATEAISEQVRLNALLKLISISGIDHKESKVEVVELPPVHLDRMVAAFKAIANDLTTYEDERERDEGASS